MTKREEHEKHYLRADSERVTPHGATPEQAGLYGASTPADFADARDRRLYRAFEMIPGMLAWGTLIAAVVLSWRAPTVVALFIIVFDFYWLLRILYFIWHVRLAYMRMQRHRRIDWRERLDQLSATDITLPGVSDWHSLYHLVVFPMYKEPLQIVRESMRALAASDYPNDRFIVVLATEERAGQEARKTAESISEEFADTFHTLLVTEHPSDVAGEVPGKGSNETHALKCAKRDVIDQYGIPYSYIVASSFDVDTVIKPQYFSCLSWHYLTAENPVRTSFQPIPFYTNNIWQASPLSRIFSFSSTFWHTMNQRRPEKLITFSSHSMSFRAMVEVGFKQPNVVSDDSRIFWQCFMRYDGDYTVVPLYYPVEMDAIIGATLLGTLRNLYKQQQRWAYGPVENTPYMLFGFLRNKRIPLIKKWRLGFERMEGNWSWATSSFLIFLLGWLPLVVGSGRFGETALSYQLPRLTSTIMTVSMIGIVTAVALSIRLLPPRPPRYGKHKYVFFVLQWALIPVIMLLFSAAPALDAQTRRLFGKYMGFWVTPKARR